MISATLYTDPGCPWAYSEIPALRVLEWRYGDQLSWRLVMVGLTEQASQYEARGYTPLRGALGQLRFRERYGMPFSPAPKARVSATSRACRAIIAARLERPGSEWAVLRALQLANFTTALVLEDDRQLAGALRELAGIDGERLVARIDDPEVVAAYERDRAETRAAEGSAAQLQGKTANTDGRVRLNCVGTIEDLARQGITLRNGMPLTLYSDDLDANGKLDELLVDGIVLFSDEEHCWVAAIDWSAIHHASEEPNGARG